MKVTVSHFTHDLLQLCHPNMVAASHMGLFKFQLIKNLVFQSL